MAKPLVRDVLYQASLLLKDSAPQFSRWKVRELVGWLNDGQRALAKYVPIASSRVDSIRLVAGARQSINAIPAARVIPGDGSAPQDVTGLSINDIVRNMGSDGATAGLSVTVVSRDFLESFSRGWSAEPAAESIDHYTHDPQTPDVFYVYPPSDGTGWVEVSYVAEPKQVPLPPSDADYAVGGSSAEVLGVDARWQDDIVNYVVARALMKDGQDAANMALSQSFAGMFVNSINAQVQVLTGKNPNLKHLPLSPQVPAAAS